MEEQKIPQGVEDRPDIRYLNSHVKSHICGACALNPGIWKDLGLELMGQDSMDDLDIISADNRGNVVGCCSALFSLWLQRQPEANWKQLIDALTKIKLNLLATEIKKSLIPSNHDQQQQSLSEGLMEDVVSAEHTASVFTNAQVNVITKAEEASAEFGILLSKILEVLLKNKDKCLKLLKSVCSTLTIKNNPAISLFTDEHLRKIMACVDIQFLFLVELRNYWRWDDFSVLSVIVSSLKSKKCEILLDQYEKKLDGKIKLSEIYEQCRKENDFPEGFHKMVAITTKLFSDITKKEYSELKNFISQHCGVEPHAISPFIKASSSSLILEWYIPGAAAAYMIDMATVNKHLFIDHGFIYLKITASVILDKRDIYQECIELLSSARTGDVASVERLINTRYVDVNYVETWENRTALLCAAKLVNPSIAEALIKSGADINAVDKRFMALPAFSLPEGNVTYYTPFTLLT